MLVIKERNVNGALASALLMLHEKGELRSSRNGTVTAFPTPVTTMYVRPTERVLFSPMRNANPTFHLVESLWMLAGRNDVKFPATFVKNMKAFSDDSDTFWGAYGYRWRDFFGWDQIDKAIQELTDNPESRRVVIGMWNAMDDTGVAFGKGSPDFIVGQSGGKDVPCNTHIYLDRRDGKLNMTVCCRSNDILWGCYGANAVHMSILQEYMALSIGCPVGWYCQVSNDLHLYNAKAPEAGLRAMAWDAINWDHYSKEGVRPTPLWAAFEDRAMFDRDVHAFFRRFDADGVLGTFNTFEIPDANYETAFFRDTVRPMVQTWAYRKTSVAALDALQTIAADDWRMSMTIWLEKQGVKA